MSLDGYIADLQGAYDWIIPVPSPALDTEHQLPFDDFLADVDIVVMGRRCYQQRQHVDYVALGKKVIVATSTSSILATTEEGVDFVGPEVVDVVKVHRGQGRHCFSSGAACWCSPSSRPTQSTC